MSTLKLRLLGKPQIELNGEPLSRLTSSKAQAVLFYMAMVARPCTRQHVAGLLWSDMDDSAALANLRVALSKLRKAAGDFLETGRQEITLAQQAVVWVDVKTFEKAADRRAAIDLYRGEFLEEFYPRDAPLFEEWMLVERERLRLVALDTLYALADEAAEAGNLEQAVEDTRRILALDEWREDAHRRLIDLLARTGQRSAALAQFDTCRQILLEALGVEPTAETLSLVERIRSGEKEKASSRPPSSKSAPPIPTAATSFVGREQELEQLAALLARDECRLVTLAGAGGMGKTRLAQQFAAGSRHASTLPTDEVRFVSLAPLPLGAGELLPARILSELELTLGSTADPKKRLLAYLQDKLLLLVLDNFEQLIEESGLIVEMLEAAPQLKLLVTSREALNLAEEWLLPLAGLPREAAVALFNSRAERIDLRFEADTEASAVHRICELVGGMPLGIELAAAWVRVISCTEIVQEIERNLDFLETDLGIVPAHQPSLRAVFASSWALLPDKARWAFSRLSRFRGGFTRQAAEQVAGATLRTLSLLVDKSFIQREPSGRYTIHELLRQFGAEKLAAEEREAAGWQHARFFADFLHGLEEARESAADLTAIRAIRADVENVRTAWQWIMEAEGQERLLDLVEQMSPMLGYFYFRVSWFQEMAQQFRQMLGGLERWRATAAGGLKDRYDLAAARLKVWLATAHFRLSDFDEVERLVESCLPVLRQHDAQREAADALNQLGLRGIRVGAFEEARSAFEASLALCDAIGDRKGRAATLNGLGILAAMRGRYDEAEAHYHESLALTRAHGYQRGVANLLNNLGSVYGRLGEYEKARKFYAESAEMAETVGETMLSAVTLSNLGAVSRALSELEGAIGYYKRALALAQEMGEQRWIVTNLNGLGATYLDQENLEAAALHLFQGLKTSMKVGVIPDVLHMLVDIARLHLKQNDQETAADILAFVYRHEAAAKLDREQAANLIAAHALDEKRVDQSLHEIVRLAQQDSTLYHSTN